MVGLVLSGGGARGAFQVGVHERLLADARFSAGPQVVSGTSAGAINAALIASGKEPADLLRFWRSLAEDPPVVAREAFLREVIAAVVRIAAGEPGRWLRTPGLWARVRQRASNHFRLGAGSLGAFLLESLLTTRFEAVEAFLGSVHESSAFDTGRLRARLVDELGGEIVRPVRGIAIAVHAVDARTGNVVRFVTAGARMRRRADYEVVEAITVDMIMASASIPLLFPPVAIGSHLLWDGGVLVNTPLAPTVALGATEIIPVLITESPDFRQRQFANLGDVLERAVDSFLENTYNVDRKLLLERNRLTAGKNGYREVALYEAIRPELSETFTAGSYLDFAPAAIDAMVEAGREAADAWLARGPVTDDLDTSSRRLLHSVPPPS